MKGREIITKIIAENGLDTEYAFGTEVIPKPKRTTKKVKEPKTLSEIADVAFEYGRLVLRISNPLAARKFGLSDQTWRYEFDGGTMYWYKSADESEPHSFSCSCGKGSYTLLSNSTEKQIEAVKTEMAEQVLQKKLQVPKDVLWDVIAATKHTCKDYPWCMQ